MSKVLIITGTSRGLGQAMAQHYLGRGWRVTGCSRGPATWSHSNYEHHVLDVSDEAAVVAMVRATARRNGGIDALINSAGVALMNHVLLTPRASFAEVLNTNVIGTFLFSREAAKAMLPRKRGRIVNIVSVAAPMLIEGEAAYAASKAAVENFTGVLARELGLHGITVNAVGPTPVETDLIKGVPPAKIDALTARQAIGRRGTPADVINVVDFFLAEESDFVTGQILYLGGIS